MNIKKIAIITLTILFALTTIATALVAFFYQTETPKSTADVEITVPVISEEEPLPQETPEEEVIPETKVLLVDASGSMKNNIAAYAGYDSVEEFSEYLGQKRGNSYIYTNVVRTLDMGVQIVGVVTDLESYPASDVNALNGKKYENVSLTFYVPADVNASYVKDYQQNWSNALNPANSTLVFVYADGSKMVVFDAYAKEEPEVTEEVKVPEKEESEIVVKVNTEATTGDSISFKSLALIFGTIIDLFCIFGIILLALFARNEKSGKGKDVPEDIQEAFELPVALDGSASVGNHYASMVAYAKKLKVAEVWRFAENVDKLSTKKAKHTPAGGNTSGWKCLKAMHDAGLSEIAIMSDFGFNDDASVADGLSFDHITLIVPVNAIVNDEVKQRIVGMCKSHKVVML